ncbi:hypothetical protein SAMN05216361_2381 [Marisediminitalea aggregata]|uniref:Uncharacterized protein n=1 Tax=Marisediminitalea aggregata TaxID=634436 RepID=A0A1M5K6Q6_9ALTE|nr:hypothetical protein SAMN05216361_2381 [Marisediminitalea aggregata]
MSTLLSISNEISMFYSRILVLLETMLMSGLVYL